MFVSDDRVLRASFAVASSRLDELAGKIGEGTSEVQRLVIARGLGLPVQ